MSLRDRIAGVAPAGEQTRLGVDRIACTGHGVCAQLLGPAVTLDEWGYPIIADVPIDSGEGGQAIRLCPARALRWR
ncbi:ferredoxin [Gordonia sp. NPDC003424]